MSEVTGNGARRWRRKGKAERPMVPKTEFTSYYGKPVLTPPVWAARDIAAYFFLGGLAGGSSLLAALSGAALIGASVATRGVSPMLGWLPRRTRSTRWSRSASG